MFKVYLLSLTVFLSIFSTSYASSLLVSSQFWKQKCSTSQPSETLPCEIPQPSSESLTQTLEWKEAPQEGNASSQHLRIEDKSKSFQAELTLFHVFPRSQTKLPKYFQVRLEFLTPYRGLCVQSVRQRDPAEIPPLMCGVWNNEKNDMSGITLKLSPNNL